MKVLLSIKPEFVEKIFSGEKKFEYRKQVFKEDVSSVVIYATMPVGRIVGEFTIRDIIKSEPNDLWDETHEYSGISKDFFMDYFSNKEFGFAIEIENLIKYDTPINPKSMFEKFIAPQSYRYIRDEFLCLTN
jgi:predicted transcriptional regulator